MTTDRHVWGHSNSSSRGLVKQPPSVSLWDVNATILVGSAIIPLFRSLGSGYPYPSDSRNATDPPEYQTRDATTDRPTKVALEEKDGSRCRE